MDVLNKWLDCECEKQRGERVTLLHAGGGLNHMWANVLAGCAAICQLDILQYARAMADNLLKHAVTVDGIEGILKIQLTEKV